MLVVMLLDDRGDRACGADAVTPHHDELLLARLVEIRHAESLRVEGPKLEDVAELDRGLHLEPPAAAGTRISRVRLADVGEHRLVVTARLHSSQMPTAAVRTGDIL